MHALDLARRASTPLVLGYVLTACADTLLDLGNPDDAPNPGDAANPGDLGDADGEALLAEAGSVLGRCPDPGIAGRYLARTASRHGRAPAAATWSGQGAAELVEPLTEREMAVLRYLPAALSQRDIAAELYVSLNTVKTHCSAIYRKLGVGDRKAAVQAARDLRLL